MFVVCWFDVRGVLLVVCCSLFAVCWLSLFLYLLAACRFSLRVGCGVLCVGCCLLRVDRWSLCLACVVAGPCFVFFVFVCALLIARCLLVVVGC